MNKEKFNILNTNIEKIKERLTNKKPQRLSVDLSSGTNLEILITPLGDNWETNRLTGTDSSFFAIGVVGYGFYPFNLNRDVGVGYIASKLGLPFAEAECLTELLNNLKINIYGTV